jgi:hypothetical protein
MSPSEEERRFRFEEIIRSDSELMALLIRLRDLCLPPCVGPVQVRNQARVHLWFENRFGAPYPPLHCADEALERYASVVHAVGVRLEADGRFDVVAPFGLNDLFAMVIRPNPVLDNIASHSRKAARAQAIWPEITVIPWNAEGSHV